MKFDPTIHHRQSIRIPDYDYRLEGGYFITVVTRQRAHIFGAVIDGAVCLIPLGEIARIEWFKTSLLRPYVEMREDEFAVMPNHVHGILWINTAVGAERCSAPTGRTGARLTGPPRLAGGHCARL